MEEVIVLEKVVQPGKRKSPRTFILSEEIMYDVSKLRHDYYQEKLSSVRLTTPFDCFKNSWKCLNFSKIHLTCPKSLFPSVYTQCLLYISLSFIFFPHLIEPSSNHENKTTNKHEDLAFLVFFLYTLHQTQPIETKIPIRISPESCLRIAEVNTTLQRIDTIFGKEASFLLSYLIKSHSFQICSSDEPIEVSELKKSKIVFWRSSSNKQFEDKDPPRRLWETIEENDQPTDDGLTIESISNMPVLSLERTQEMSKKARDYAKTMEQCGVKLREMKGYSFTSNLFNSRSDMSDSLSAISELVGSEHRVRIGDKKRLGTVFQSKSEKAYRFADRLILAFQTRATGPMLTRPTHWTSLATKHIHPSSNPQEFRNIKPTRQSSSPIENDDRMDTSEQYRDKQLSLSVVQNNPRNRVRGVVGEDERLVAELEQELLSDKNSSSSLPRNASTKGNAKAKRQKSMAGEDERLVAESEQELLSDKNSSSSLPRNASTKGIVKAKRKKSMADEDERVVAELEQELLSDKNSSSSLPRNAPTKEIAKAKRQKSMAGEDERLVAELEQELLRDKKSSSSLPRNASTKGNAKAKRQKSMAGEDERLVAELEQELLSDKNSSSSLPRNASTKGKDKAKRQKSMADEDERLVAELEQELLVVSR